MAWTLFIGNKAYSSWSLRPWILMRHFGIPFTDKTIPLDQSTTGEEIRRHSPTGRVPLLEADGVRVWESLAIMEFLAERFPDLAIWPADPEARTLARSLASEMHAGFQRLRQTCPTNFRRPQRAIAIPDDARRDVDRIEEAWAGARERWGQGGPFLFGAFTAADAMFAPVINRLWTYAIPVRPETAAYMAAVMALPAWHAWIEGAEAEPWFIDRYEAI
ncbi:glutathione S-transferase family protein [Lichenihabitans sp. Uapishka_5]|uniref:glutathione S-transferase family protein n=1 Tax=Lichenihabitans sp. Uapishka_5 TaxID=3037302 RepID=UPI0029E7FD13|nr:glutathione S-transferase family protein [Lichenihabitans sp. Uapishka_5]MDX7950169.1 glutathione S-transferase family protein [Lichenihabitans sp. Uapishka_5]